MGSKSCCVCVSVKALCLQSLVSLSPVFLFHGRFSFFFSLLPKVPSPRSNSFLALNPSMGSSADEIYFLFIVHKLKSQWCLEAYFVTLLFPFLLISVALHVALHCQ